MEANKETIEEAAEKFAINIQTKAGTMSRENAIEWFKAGAKWQAKRRYSEEEVKSAYAEGGFAIMRYLEGKECLDVDKWFEQFKKK